MREMREGEDRERERGGREREGGRGKGWGVREKRERERLFPEWKWELVTGVYLYASIAYSLLRVRCIRTIRNSPRRTSDPEVFISHELLLNACCKHAHPCMCSSIFILKHAWTSHYGNLHVTTWAYPPIVFVGNIVSSNEKPSSLQSIGAIFLTFSFLLRHCLSCLRSENSFVVQIQ